MTRAEREALAVCWAQASEGDLRREIAARVDRHLDLKRRRCPDLSDSIDGLIVLLTLWRDRGLGFVLHAGRCCSVDAGGELWVTEVSPIRARILRQKLIVEAAESGRGGLTSEAESARMEERQSAWRRKADAILEAAGRVVGRGEPLTSAAIRAELRQVMTTTQIANTVKGLRTRGEWPEDWQLTRPPAASRPAPKPEPTPERPERPELPEAEWVPLGWDLPGWEGTIDGRVRRSPDYVHTGSGTPKIQPGEELAPHPRRELFGLTRPNRGPITITRFGVGKRVAKATGRPIPHHLDRRQVINRKRRQAV